MHTHICIQTPERNIHIPLDPKVKKGDYVTFKDSGKNPAIMGEDWMEFEEHPGHVYASYLFLPIPPQKTVYVAVCEEVKKEIEHPCLS